MPARNFRFLSVFLTLSLFPASLAFADLLSGVSVSGSVSGSGNLDASAGCPGYPTFNQGYSFSQSNSQSGLGSYSLNQSGNVTCGSTTASSATQGADVTGNSFMVTDVVSASTGGGAGFIESANASSSLTLSFDLNQPALVDLTQSLNISCEYLFPSSGTCPLSLSLVMANATASVQLIGPGGDVPLLPSLNLGNGDYKLEVSGSASAMTIDIPGSGVSNLSLDAEFTAIPEPRWLSGLAVLLLVGLHRFRRAAAQN